MGACDSMGEDLNGQKTRTNPSIASFSTNFTGKTNKYSYEKGDYILPTSIAKRDDVAKYYSLSNKMLGSGASGQVYIGIKGGIKYAIKRISKAKIKYIDEIINEARISLSLKHPNIIKFFEVYEDLKFITYVMELGEGGDLFDFITGCPTGHLPTDIAIELLLQMFDVINYLHNVAHVIHRDLKPENFMIRIDANNRPILKLIDFGLATFCPKGGDLLKQFVGTPEYAAPELCNKNGYGEKVDEWAMGVIMFNMLTGFEPFNGNNREQLKYNITYGTIQFDYIQENDLKELNKLLLERNISKRISSGDAYKMLLQMKQQRTMTNRCMSPQIRRGGDISVNSSYGRNGVIQSISQNSFIMNGPIPSYTSNRIGY